MHFYVNIHISFLAKMCQIANKKNALKKRNGLFNSESKFSIQSKEFIYGREPFK